MIINIMNKKIVQNNDFFDIRKKNIEIDCEIGHIVECSPYLPLPL